MWWNKVSMKHINRLLAFIYPRQINLFLFIFKFGNKCLYFCNHCVPRQGISHELNYLVTVIHMCSLSLPTTRGHCINNQIINPQLWPYGCKWLVTVSWANCLFCLTNVVPLLLACFISGGGAEIESQYILFFIRLLNFLDTL